MQTQVAVGPANSLRPSILFLYVALASFFAYLVVSSESDKSGLVLLSALGLVQVLPLVLSLSRGKVCFLDLVLFNHFVVFTVSRLNLLFNLEGSAILPSDVNRAVEVLLYCSGLIIAGHIMVRNLLFRRYFDEVAYEPLTLTPSRHFSILIFILLVPVLLDFVPSAMVVPMLAGSSVGFVVLFTSRVPLAPKREIWGRIFLLVSSLHSFVISGAMGVVSQFAGIFFITVCLRRKFSHLWGLVIFVIGLSAIQSVKSDYRFFMQANLGSGMSERIECLMNLLFLRYSSQNDETMKVDERERDLAQGFARVGDNSLETVLEQSPSKVPFWNGETYAVIPYFIIPRFLWPEKPVREFWNKYGKVYGILSEDDYQTAVGVGYLAEAYMNYGFVGIYLLSFGFGIAIAFLERCTAVFMGGPSMLGFIVFLLPVIGYSSDLGSMVSSLALATGLMVILNGVLKSNGTRDAYGQVS